MNLFILTITELLNSICDMLQMSGDMHPLNDQTRNQLEEKTIDLISSAIELYRLKERQQAVESLLG